ncbi:HAD family phosphatase [Pseudotenacibaculum sp. MALMAid0570]|uniref:HAD family hydrolase n=1 Tax=Pseudotenacibaculum sp. MALMAid0570 TaxID=3143938 RepID=UPI0032DEDC2C
MIKNIIFDYGDVFINLDKPATEMHLLKLGLEQITEEMLDVCKLYETGQISTQEFVETFTTMYPAISEKQFIDAWNAILKDFPLHRLQFIKELAASGKYRLFLLSNTNELHISWIQNDWRMELYNEFKDCFEQFYLSHEIQLRKPNANIYEFVLNENALKPEESFFIDDTKENTDAAKKLGIHVWNINPETEDVVDLLAQKEFEK